LPHADIIEDRIFVQTQWNERELVKLVPGARWHTERKLWHVPLSWVACLQLRGVFKERLTVGGSLAEWSLNEYHGRVRPAHELRSLTVSSDYKDTDLLYEFQRAGVNFMAVAGSVLLGDDMGLGKTIQML
jgi:SNF2 family DNA or RNA helicase